MWQRFTNRARRAILIAHDEASQMRMHLIGTEHLLLGLIRLGEGMAAEILRSLNVDLGQLRSDLRRNIDMGSEDQPSNEISFTPEAQRVLQLAYTQAKELSDHHIGTEHILLGLAREGRGAAYRTLRRHNINGERVRQQILQLARADAEEADGPSETPTLDHFSRDLTELARESTLDPIIGRDVELERVVQILCRRTKNNPCLIGDAGVGKTAIAEGLAQRIASGEVPEPLRDRRLVALDLASLVAGTKYRGEFEERMKRVMEEIRASQGRIIIFIDELHTIVGTGAAEGAMDASNILKPALSRGELQCIGATTPDEFRKHIEKTPSLERRFQAVRVEEPSPEEALDILFGIKSRYEDFHRVDLTEDALSAAVDLSSRYITDRSLPDKAIDLIDEAGSRVKLRRYRERCETGEFSSSFCRELEDEPADMLFFPDAEEDEVELVDADEEPRPEVLRHDIAEIVSTWTGVPVTQLSQEESQRLLKMEGALVQRVVGQDEAITTVSRAVRRARAGVKDPRRPIGSFMFLGPTGVGKTLMARVLADYLFGDEDAMIRIDMSEYMERFAVSRLIGAPPGYVGYEEAGQLSEAVRRRPYSVVLFDEIEKAHPEVFSILLQIMEDGRLTDAQGRVVDFKNTVIIMTSNVGARTISDNTRMGFSTDANARSVEQERREYDRMKSKVTDELKKAFSPEFLNRVDDVVVFHSLTQEQIRDIVQLEIGYLNERLVERELHVTITGELEDMLAERGFDPSMGARPLRRQIRSLIEDPLAEQILACETRSGCEIMADLDEDGRVTFRFVETAVSPHPA
ncbi:MAG: ATP-dependent Clp protease ATP-binding subunit [candidate division WS1 bacterium]|nr:ATP-dependent Clp protease ATP-binding subunit [candidate division WS1 bacterium]